MFSVFKTVVKKAKSNMRIYKVDGSFEDNPNDTEFGWYFDEIMADRKSPDIEEVRVQPPRITSIEDSFMESVDIVEPAPQLIMAELINPNIKIEPVVNVQDCKMEIEGLPVNKNEPQVSRELRLINFAVPPKERLAKLINPCNFETRMLMSIVYLAKSKTLMKKEAAEELQKTVNHRTTNFKYLIKESDVQEEMYREIRNYHATKEENMLSLMMELILTDMNCNLEDIVDTNQQSPVKKREHVEVAFETSDLGNSIQSSCSSKGDKTNYLVVKNRSGVLSSIGLSEEDKSIQSLRDEAYDMHSHLVKIRRSFHEDEDRVNNLIKMAMDLEKDLKETLYLNDILHLLKGDIEKVKLKKLPFRIFHKDEEESCDLNLIV